MQVALQTHVPPPAAPQPPPRLQRHLQAPLLACCSLLWYAHAGCAWRHAGTPPPASQGHAGWAMLRLAWRWHAALCQDIQPCAPGRDGQAGLERHAVPRLPQAEHPQTCRAICSRVQRGAAAGKYASPAAPYSLVNSMSPSQHRGPAQGRAAWLLGRRHGCRLSTSRTRLQGLLACSASSLRLQRVAVGGRERKTALKVFATRITTGHACGTPSR